MAEEFARWVDAAKPAWPWALGALALLVTGGVMVAFFLRRRAIEARQDLVDAQQDRKRAEHLWRKIDCVVQPTVAIDMSVLTAHRDKARFDPRRVLTGLRERRAVSRELPAQPDWAPGELASIPQVPDTYKPRGFLPRLRRKPFTPADLAARIQQIKAEQKEASA